MEARTAAKWEQQGWEVVSQAPGKLTTELVIRRPQPKRPWRFLIAGGSVLVVALVAVIIFGIVSEQNSDDTAQPPTESAAPPSDNTENLTDEEAGAPVSPEDSETDQESDAEDEPSPSLTLTAESDAEFARILTLGDNCSEDIAAFASSHEGDILAFDANVSFMSQHGDYDTRWDILLGGGDYSETDSSGPTFQYRDVNTTNDLHYAGDIPDAISAGSNLAVRAEVVEYEESSCLFLLKPVETRFR